MGRTGERKSTASKLLLACGFLVFLAVGVPSPSSAGQDCDAECLPEDDCPGGCEIDSIDCTVSCADAACGQDAICQEEVGCPTPRSVVATECTEQGGGGPFCPPDQTPCPGQLRSADLRTDNSVWAVVEFETDGHVVSPAQVLAQSHLYAGDTALQQLEARAHELWSARSEASGRQRLIWVSPGRPCVTVDVELLNRQAPFPAPGRRSLAFFDVRITADGSYVAIEPLYSELPRTRTREAATYLRENLVLSSPNVDARSVQVFVGLIFNNAGEVGYAVAGANELL